MTNSSHIDKTIGEVVESATGSFGAQCLEYPASGSLKLLDPPAFGAFVKISPSEPAAAPIAADESGEEVDPFRRQVQAYSASCYFEPGTILAVVASTKMSSLDSGRRPMALGYPTEDELRLHQPQIFDLIVTEFSGLLIGHADGSGRLRLGIPPTLPRIHSLVLECSAAETRAATAELTYLRRILDGAVSAASAEDLCAAVIRHGWQARAESAEYLGTAGRQLAIQVAGEYDRLQRIVRSVIA